MTSDTKQSASSTRPAFGVYGVLPSKTASAWRYYRSEVPLRTIYDLGLGYNYFPNGDDPEMDNNAILGASIVTAWQLMGDLGYHFAHLFAKQLPEFADDPKTGERIYRPLLVMDSDDALDLCDPFNPSYASLGVRNWDGSFLNPGDSVMYPMKDGTETALWEDKKRYGQGGKLFDIERNLRSLALYYETARLCAGVTVTNETLAKIYRDEGIEEVYVFPNSVIPNDYPTVQLAPHKGIRLLWEGGSSHVGSWMTIKEPLYAALRDNPNVTLVVFGEPPANLKNELPPEQFEVHPWVDYAAYKFKRVMLQADINLCPLLNNPFNECKSAIRWYEGCMSPTPEPTLASNVGPYKEIEDGRTGLLFNTEQEFREKLQSLIDNVGLRRRLGEAGRRWVWQNRDAKVTVPGLMDFYTHLRDKQRTADVRRTLAAGV